MENEVWKDLNIEGYEGLYAVSNLGRFKALSRKRYHVSPLGKHFTTTSKEKILALVDNGTGYKQVRLYNVNERKAFYIHVLVLEAFVERPSEEYEVDHIDEDKSNNRLENLRWVTRKDNMKKCWESNPHIRYNLPCIAEKAGIVPAVF